MSKKTAKPHKPASKRSPSQRAAAVVDAELERYRSMRDFSTTAEPSGMAKSARSKPSSAELPFVVQKHAASHLHYDLRLGWNGVLKSWAVAKGPSYNPKDRRLAVQVEDHPIEYGGFEGIIPQGQYGGGTVMVWDQGRWSPLSGHEDVDAGLREGHLKFQLWGTKLRGHWALVRMNPRAGSKPSAKPNWLLIKEHDDFERGPSDPAITDEAADSVLTRRSLEQIAQDEDHLWNSNANAKPTRASPARLKGRLAGLPKETQPGFIAPELALESTKTPSGAEWIHELKLDGYRMQARKSGGSVLLLTRSGVDWTHRMAPLAKAVAQLPCKACTLDGEVVVLDAVGNSSFADLQASFQNSSSGSLQYFLFDLLHLDGHSTRALPLHERKILLQQLLPPADPLLRLSEDIEGDGPQLFRHACDLHAEGLVSKRADSPYRGTRSSDWLKSKCLHEQEFVIAGYTLSSEGADRIGALILAYYAGKDLVYAGRTGTGFTQKLRRELFETLRPLVVSQEDLRSVPAAARRGVQWVKPRLVCQVRFATWTSGHLVRQAAFLGLREDKSPHEVRREDPSVAPAPKHHASHAAHAVANAAKVQPAAPVRLTHPDKILDPQSGLTKRQLADYYLAIAEHMLPYIADRPVSLVRCPDGSTQPCFFQKHVNPALPPGIGTVQVPDKKTGTSEPYITLNTPEALAGLAQLGVLELHPWGSRNSDLEHPDRLVFDLDPDPELPWSTLAAAATEVRQQLKRAGLQSFLKLTGGKGLHIVAPIEPTLTWAELKAAAHSFVRNLERGQPELYLTRMTKSARKGRIYLDYLRNERGATAVAPFSPRARPGAPVSLPLPWSALKRQNLPVFTVHEFVHWRAHLRPDPWKALLSIKQSLDPKIFDPR